VAAALQAAWSAIVTTPVPAEDPASKVFRADHLRLVLAAAVRGGGDTDTVASIAGAMVGAAGFYMRREGGLLRAIDLARRHEVSDGVDDSRAIRR
jgi:hypothetical protein